ncbi:TolC family protein [Microbulbifer sp. OS29]|uniref:TolC family protein n=1 Tax=Microbulbifer okhotskensis TaxID=2926617 RepID=A0A9X2ERG7_9GAMM|nr:TolC family protein [Microbulbifer okhotskensis]MCO1334356.1 TolC family protein [Microbulbifer okhotskensis]
MDLYRTLIASVIRRHAAWLLVVTILCLPAQSVFAQKGDLLTLPDAIGLTLAQNPELSVYPVRKRGLEGAEQTAALKPALELGIETEYKHFSEDSSDNAPDPEDGADNEFELTVTLSSVIELGNKRRARVDVVNAQRDLLIADEQARALDLLAEVIRRYAQVLAAQELVVLGEEKVVLARETLNAVSARVSAAASPVSERMRAESALAKAKLAEKGNKRMLVYYKLALSALWGQPAPDYQVDSSELYRFEPGASFHVLYEQAQENPAIARFASEERLQASQLRLTQANSRPDVGWYAGLRANPAVDETAILAGFNVPLFSAKRNRGAVITAMTELDEVMLRREATLLQLYPQLYLAVTSREQALGTVSTLQDSVIPKLRQALREVDRAYRRGRDSYVDLISAREELLDAERARIEAARSILLFGAEIEQLTARPLGLIGVDSSK